MLTNVREGFVCALTLGLALGLCSASAATAQESHRFTGLYGGVHIGYGYGAPDLEISGSEDGAAEIEKVFDITPDKRNNSSACQVGSSCRYARDGVFAGGMGNDADGVLAGLHLGYNFQLANFLLGVEGDYDFTEIEGNGRGEITAKAGSLYTGQTLDETPAYLTAKSSFDNLASIRGRLGYTVGSLLVYGTGGVAWTDFKGSITSPEGYANPVDPTQENESATISFKDSMTGWVAGGGLEYLITKNVSLRAEWLHYEFDTIRFSAEDEGNIEQMEGKQDVSLDQVRAAISYHLN